MVKFFCHIVFCIFVLRNVVFCQDNSAASALRRTPGNLSYHNNKQTFITTFYSVLSSKKLFLEFFNNNPMMQYIRGR